MTLDTIRISGQCYHYRIASGIEWLLLAFPGDSDLPVMLENIAALPNRQGCISIANDAMAVLKGYSRQLDPVKYAAIFTVLNEALSELS